MSRLALPTHDEIPADSLPLLDAVHAQLGVVPNLYRIVGRSPAALEGLLALTAALGKTLVAKSRERIALAVAEANGCDYCLSAHSYLGAKSGLDATEIALNRKGHSGDAKADAALIFAAKVAKQLGKVSDADIAAVKRAGFTDAQIVEIVVNVALNVMTNFVNNVAETDIDFPVVHAASPLAA